MLQRATCRILVTYCAGRLQWATFIPVSAIAGTIERPRQVGYLDIDLIADGGLRLFRQPRLMEPLHDSFSAHRDQHADDDGGDLLQELGPPMPGFGIMDVLLTL